MEESVEAQRQMLVEQVRTEVEEMKEVWREALWQEQDSFLQNLRQQIAQQTYRIIRRALQDLANVTLEHQVIGVFIDRLRQLDEGARNEIVQSLEGSRQAIVVRTSFEMPQDQRQPLIDLLQEQFGSQNRIWFNTSPAPICGIEVKLAGHEIAWSLDDYLQNLEESLFAAIEQEARRENEPRSQAIASSSR